MPENARGHCSPGRPRSGESAELLVVGKAPQPLDLLCRFGQRKIAVGPDIGATQRHQQVDVRGPGTDAGNLEQPGAPRMVIELRQVAEREGAIDDAYGELSTVRRLLTRQAGVAKPGFPEPGDTGGRHATGSSLESRVRRAAGRKGHLLLQNDADKRREPWATRAERWWPEAINNGCEVTVAGTELLDASKQCDRGQ